MNNMDQAEIQIEKMVASAFGCSSTAEGRAERIVKEFMPFVIGTDKDDQIRSSVRIRLERELKAVIRCVMDEAGHEVACAHRTIDNGGF